MAYTCSIPRLAIFDFDNEKGGEETACFSWHRNSRPSKELRVSTLEEEDEVSSDFTADDGNAKNALIRLFDRAMI